MINNLIILAKFFIHKCSLCLQYFKGLVIIL
uniref:Uncharacterized protein n=1 Tax=Anguilla anguilla TaxID=7936 RepID=A0A0E9XB52_ANGAN